MVTIIDVANYAGVSKSTVSLVLNKSPRVKAETRLRVEDAIRTLGYVCNNNARGLRKRETKCLGVIISIESKKILTYEFNYETGQFSYGITNGIPDGLEDTDYGMIVERFSQEQAANGEIPQIVKNGRVDGAFLVGGLFTDEVIREIQSYGIPLVSVGYQYGDIDCVYADVAKGMYLQADELLRSGCRRLALINAPHTYTSAKDRLVGWDRALAPYAHQVEKTWQINCHQNHGEGGYLAIKKLWEAGARPDGIAAANEPIAMGVMRYLFEQGVRIPEDISIVGYEASTLGGYASPPLTSVNIHKEQMGAIAARMLIKRIENPAIPRQLHMVDPAMLVRASVKTK